MSGRSTSTGRCGLVRLSRPPGALNPIDLVSDGHSSRRPFLRIARPRFRNPYRVAGLLQVIASMNLTELESQPCKQIISGALTVLRRASPRRRVGYSTYKLS